jgi:hypothetical protein
MELLNTERNPTGLVNGVSALTGDDLDLNGEAVALLKLLVQKRVLVSPNGVEFVGNEADGSGGKESATLPESDTRKKKNKRALQAAASIDSSSSCASEEPVQLSQTGRSGSGKENVNNADALPTSPPTLSTGGGGRAADARNVAVAIRAAAIAVGDDLGIFQDHTVLT